MDTIVRLVRALGPRWRHRRRPGRPEVAAQHSFAPKQRALVLRNTCLLRLINWFASVSSPPEAGPGRLAWWRLALVCLCLARYVLLSLVDTCSQARFRLLMLDWTVIVPRARRMPIVRYHLAMCLVQLAVKRAPLLKCFDRRLFDYLSQAPPAEVSARPRPQPPAQPPHEARRPACGLFARRHELGPGGFCLDQRHWLTIHEEALAPHALARDAAHWYLLSRQLWRHFLLVAGLMCTLMALIVAGVLQRVLFLFQVSRPCDLYVPGMRGLAALESIYLYAEMNLSLVGIFTHALVVRSDLTSQAARLSHELHMLAQLVDARQGSLRRVAASGRGPNQLPAPRILHVQQLAKGLVSSLAQHKPLVSFFGAALVLWLATILSFAPLLETDEAQSDELHMNRLMVAGLAANSAVSFIFFASLCASVSRQIAKLAGPIYKITGHCDIHLSLTWNKLLGLWFNPDQSSFPVYSLLKLDHLGILKAFGYLLTGMTLIVNFNKR